ncbi:hypothetical protein GCM10007047_10750 [Cerasicoccus arenae]|uniref:Uncharacterized protein n=2 Tax=Cerasicoccus arenae TaxID=424488 RepID=A0A8J3DGC3_9BACT|nr:hypothetical protein GCM10007047_10750 [Cerasicoccus arenae]
MSDLATLFYDVDGKKEVIHAGLGAFSRLYPSPSNRRVVFYREDPNPDPRKPPIKATVADATLPSGEGPYLVLLISNPSPEGFPFSTLVIDHSLKVHPANNYRVFNFSKRRMAVRLAEKDMLLNRGESETVPYPDARKAWLKVAADEEGSWLVVTSSSHSVGSDSRTTVFIVDIPPSERDPDPKGVVARRMRERIVTDEFGEQHVK